MPADVTEHVFDGVAEIRIPLVVLILSRPLTRVAIPLGRLAKLFSGSLDRLAGRANLRDVVELPPQRFKRAGGVVAMHMDPANTLALQSGSA